MNLSIYHRFIETYGVLRTEYQVKVLQRFSQPKALWAFVSEDHGLMLASVLTSIDFASGLQWL